MKKWTIQLTLHEGADEFFESNPSYEKIEDMIGSEIYRTPLVVEGIKVLKFEETH